MTSWKKKFKTQSSGCTLSFDLRKAWSTKISWNLDETSTLSLTQLKAWIFRFKTTFLQHNNAKSHSRLKTESPCRFWLNCRITLIIFASSDCYLLGPMKAGDIFLTTTSSLLLWKSGCFDWWRYFTNASQISEPTLSMSSAEKFSLRSRKDSSPILMFDYTVRFWEVVDLRTST